MNRNPRKTIGSSLLILGLFPIIISCSGDSIPTNCPQSEAVHLKAVVRGWRCGVGDCYSNPPPSSPQILFSVTTGETARITLIRDNGFETEFYTDDSSSAEIYLSAGSFDAIVETAFTYPSDTFHNIHLFPGDTALYLDIVYAVTDPDHITFEFVYMSMDDTAGAQDEWDRIWVINQLARLTDKGLPLRLRTSMPPDTFRTNIIESNGRAFIDHEVPINRNFPEPYNQIPGRGYNVMEAYYHLWDIQQSDTAGRFDHIGLFPTGIYFCLSK